MTDESSASPQLIYRLVRFDEWKAAVRDGTYRGSAHDRTDGFIHCSRAGQVEGTAEKHYADADDLFILTLDVERLDGDIRWEVSRGGEPFPHLYGSVPIAAVLGAERVQRDREGRFQFPHLKDF